MNNAEVNEPQDKQTKRTAESPVKTPGAETAHIKMGDAVKAAAGGGRGACRRGRQDGDDGEDGERHACRSAGSL